jgi:hypothetical protein
VRRSFLSLRFVAPSHGLVDRSAQRWPLAWLYTRLSALAIAQFNKLSTSIVADRHMHCALAEDWLAYWLYDP